MVSSHINCKLLQEDPGTKQDKLQWWESCQWKKKKKVSACEDVVALTNMFSRAVPSLTSVLLIWSQSIMNKVNKPKCIINFDRCSYRNTIAKCWTNKISPFLHSMTSKIFVFLLSGTYLSVRASLSSSHRNEDGNSPFPKGILHSDH